MSIPASSNEAWVGSPSAPSASPVRQEPTRLQWREDLAQARLEARREGRALCMFVFAQWSAAALEQQRGVLREPRVQQALSPYVTVVVDVTDPDDPQSPLGWLPTRVLGALVLETPDGVRQAVLEPALDETELIARLAEFLAAR